MDKKISKVLICMIGCMIVTALLSIRVFAASIGMSASAGTVAPGQQFTVYVGGNVTGRINLSVSNGTLSQNTIWVEGNTVGVTVTAGQSGSVTVTAVPLEGLSNLDGTDADASSRSVTVSIQKPNNGGGSWTPNGGGSGSSSGNSQTKPETPDPEDDTHSKDNDLKSLTVSEGKLSPEFSKDTTSYTVNLPATAKSVTLKAEANDAKAMVEGTGEKNLEPGDNDFEIIVTAENKSVKAYKIKVIVDEKPLLYMNYNGAKLGVVRNIRSAPVPSNFTATTLKVKGKEIPAWKNDAMKKTIVYLMDAKNKKQFYLYENGKVTSTFTPAKLLGREVFLIDIPEAQQQRTGMNYQKLTIEKVNVMGWTYKEKSLKNYELIYVMDLDGECRYYQYEKSQHTIQLYSGAAAVTQSEYAKQVKDLKGGKTAMTYTAVALGLVAAGIGCYAAYLTIHKKK